MRKFAVGAEAVIWLLIVGVVGTVGIPVGVLLALVGLLLSWVHIDFFKGVVDCFLLWLMKFARFATHRVKQLTRKAEALKSE
ncbi:MAG: hypothetical protein IJR85_02780 [Synergistaceae bacterium]|nr:hypothetical protein [Synergistaceae bacterium]